MKLQELIKNQQKLIMSIILLILMLISLKKIITNYRYIIYEFEAIDLKDMQRPINDISEMRYLRLKNGLEVMLISDPLINRLGAAMTVDVGSCYEQLDYERGIAHLLEHMLFQGSHKYPSQSYFKSLLSTHAGKSNAMTSDEYTTYYFHIHKQGDYEAVLDSFSRFFIDPLLDSKMVQNEINAVHSEYEKDLVIDSWRFLELLRKQSYKHHAFYRFTIGNKLTLNQNVHQQVTHFYNNYYSAHKMKLILIGSYSIEYLQNLAIDKFYSLKKHNVTDPFLSKNKQTVAFNETNLGKFVWYKPIKNENTLSFVYYIPKSDDAKSIYKNYVDFMIYFINSRDVGSFFENLRIKGWSTSISAKVIRKSTDFDLIVYQVKVTEKGLQNIKKIINYFYQIIQLIQDDPNVIKIYKQVQQLSYYRFFFREKPPIEEEMLNIIYKISNTNFKYLLSDEEVLTDFNQTIFNQFIQLLMPENGLFIIGSENIQISDIFDYEQQLIENSKRFKKKNNITQNIFRFKLKKNNVKSLNSNTYKKLQYNLIENGEVIQVDREVFLKQKESLENEYQLQEYLIQNQVNNQDNNYYDKNKEQDYISDKKLNQYDKMMKFYYAEQKITQQELDEFLTFEDKQNFNLPNFSKFQPQNLDLDSECPLVKRQDQVKKVQNFNKQAFELLKVPSFIIQDQKEQEIVKEFEKKYINNSTHIYDLQCFQNEINEEKIEIGPKLIVNNNYGKLWLKSDRIQGLPKTIFLINYKNDLIDLKLVQNQAKAKLLVKIIREQLENVIQSIYKVDYDFEFMISSNGIQYQLKGFSDQIEKIVQQFSKKISDPEWNQNKFSKLKVILIKGLQQDKNEQAIHKLSHILNNILEKKLFTTEQMIINTNDLTLEQIRQFHFEYFNNCEIEVLITGNINQKLATNIYNSVQRLLSLNDKIRFKSIKDNNINKNNDDNKNNSINNNNNNNISNVLINKNMKTIKLENNSTVILSMSNQNKKDNNHAIINYYQFGQKTIKNQLLMNSFINTLHSQAFLYLRTQKQLGYIVQAQQKVTNNQLGVTISIQGSVKSPNEMDQQIEMFLEKYYQQLVDNSFISQVKSRRFIQSSFITFSNSSINKPLQFQTSLNTCFNNYKLNFNINTDNNNFNDNNIDNKNDHYNYYDNKNYSDNNKDENEDQNDENDQCDMQNENNNEKTSDKNYHNQLQSKTYFYWNEIMLSTFNYEQDEIIKQELKKLTKKDVLNYYKQNMITNRRKISLQMESNIKQKNKQIQTYQQQQDEKIIQFDNISQFDIFPLDL